AAPTREKLLAAVHATPHDDGPRAVFADVLLEAGDPRGELIVLQLQRHHGEGTPGTARREHKLLKQLGSACYDGLDLDGANAIVVERGFPISATLAVSGELRSPAWATIEALTLSDGAVFGGSPHLRALRRLYNLASRDLLGGELPSYDLELLAVAGYDHGLGVPTRYAPRTLGLAQPRDLGAMLACIRELGRLPIGRRVETVRLGHGIRELPAITRFLTTGTAHPAIELGGGSRLDLPTDWTARVTPQELRLAWWGCTPWSDIAFETIYPVVRELGRAPFESLVVSGIDHPATSKVRDALRREVAHWPALRNASIFGVHESAGN
ncbi:MAG: TIGR02996 domain-containing protein, partial [Myxococcota bacterium]|nr:TIGR02996 domain-containing protein [Myxococcota bacterium]